MVYLKPGSVEVQKIDFPTFRNPAGKTIDHGVILKVVTTNICGSDQRMVRGRTTGPAGMVLGHEITGEAIERGRDVEYLEVWRPRIGAFQRRMRPLPDLSRGRQPASAFTSTPTVPGAYDMSNMGGWIGGSGRLRDGTLRRFQPAEISRQGVDVKADAGVALSTGPAAAACDVERHPIPGRQPQDTRRRGLSRSPRR